MPAKKRVHHFAPMTLTGFVSGIIAATLIASPFLGTITEHSEGETHFVAASDDETTQRVVDVAPLTEEEWTAFRAARAALFQSTLRLSFPKELQEVLEENQKTEWHLPLFDHPEWIIVERRNGRIVATLEWSHLAAFLAQEIDPLIPRASNLSLLALPKEGDVRAKVEGAMADGWVMDAEITARQIAESVAAQELNIILPIEKEEAVIENKTNAHVGALTLLASGKSDFAGSVPNRIYNIKKAINEKINGVYIAPGETFSFVEVLDGPVELWTGWLMALGIFEGSDLRPTPGGGVCQISTTVYRAAVLAGLPITEQRNHSMYIKYYRKHGEGLDATIFVGHQDLAFVNDTEEPILILARTVGTEAIVEFYGTRDGRTVALEGPYRYHDAPEGMKSLVRNERNVGLQGNEIAWKQTITRVDGTTEEKALISRYQDEIPWKTTADANVYYSVE